MYFENLTSLLQMDGHGIYVWPAYLVTICMIILLLVLPIRRRKRALQQVANEIRREQRMKNNAQEIS